MRQTNCSRDLKICIEPATHFGGFENWRLASEVGGQTNVREPNLLYYITEGEERKIWTHSIPTVISAKNLNTACQSYLLQRY